MSDQLRYQLWIVAAAAVIFLVDLGGAGLWDMDEALYTTCAREMIARNDLVVPWFNGQMFPEKPPLMFWGMMAGFQLFGVNEWGARFASAVLGVGTALLAFHLGRILFNLRVGLWAGLITASTIIFTVSARAATVDSALTFFTTLAMLLFLLAWREFQANGRDNRFRQWTLLAGSYACVGVAVLGKGPVGMLLPLAAMGLYLLVANGWRKLFWSAWWMRPFTALLVVAAVAVPWYALVGYRTNGEWLRVFFLEFNLRPFKQPILGHGDVSSFDRIRAALASLAYYFYQVPAVLVGFFPWSVFLGPTLVDTIRRIRNRGEAVGRGADTATSREDEVRWRDGTIFACCWFAVWLVFWSVCKTKLPHYLLPAYPALALLTACFVERWLANPAAVRWVWLRNAWISMVLTGVGIMIALPIVAARYLPGEWLLTLVGLPLVLGGIGCWKSSLRGEAGRTAMIFTVTAVVFLVGLFAFGARRVDRYQNGPPMLAAIRADSLGVNQPPIATYRFFRESTVYCAGYPVARCEDGDAGRSARKDLEKFFAEAAPKVKGRAYVITTSEHERELRESFPDRFQAIFRQRRFLGPGEMVVLRAGS